MPAVDPVIGDMLQTRMPIGSGEVPRAAPLLGEHSREVLAELGFGVEDVEALVAGGVVMVGSERGT